ncbi:peptidoglycan -binding protein [Pseudoroseomonas globiformis]|uniref:Peptidoglycan -binding protein n=1 Tax=Teichococcus globiformis TaxID=2307229 RepID=A0ABV7G0X2_9PROT
MALRRRKDEGLNAWPGYVDALSTLLMVIIFVLLVFVLAQGFLSVTLSSRDQALDRLDRQVAELSDLLALERGQGNELRASLGRLSEELRLATAARDAAQAEAGELRGARDRQVAEGAALRDERDRLQARLADLELSAGGASSRIASLEQRLAEAQARAEALGGGNAQTVRELTEARQTLQAERESNVQEASRLSEQIRALAALRDELERQAAEALARAEAEGRARQQAEAGRTEQARLADSSQAQIALLNRQLTELRVELSRIAGLLDAEEAAGRDKEAQITALGQRLNTALAARVEELQRYRSDFFGRLRDVLGERPEIRVVGDRFVFQGEVLFPVGGADLSEAGRTQLRSLAVVLKEVSQRFPADLPWILRVDGHADRSPVRPGGRYASNWELSAARAIAVGQFLIGEGLPANHIAAAAFGDNQPLDAGDSTDAFARNRRIELRLTDR